MLSIYPACFFKEKEGYTVLFPDLNWLSTCGSTLEEVMERAIDCLAGYLYTSTSQEQAPPSELDTIDITAIARELEISPSQAFINMVSVDVEEYAKTHFARSVRKTLTIPRWMNEAAIALGINFSQVLQEALLEKIQAKRSY